MYIRVQWFWLFFIWTFTQAEASSFGTEKLICRKEKKLPVNCRLAILPNIDKIRHVRSYQNFLTNYFSYDTVYGLYMHNIHTLGGYMHPWPSNEPANILISGNCFHAHSVWPSPRVDVQGGQNKVSNIFLVFLKRSWGIK